MTKKEGTKMIKQMVALPEPMYERLKREAEDSGIPVPELVRGIVRVYLRERPAVEREKERERKS